MSAAPKSSGAVAEPEAEASNDEQPPATETNTKKEAKSSSSALPLPSKFYVRPRDLLQFLYPAHWLHPNATLRLFLYAEHGPLFNHHSYHQCLCMDCKEKCKAVRKQNDVAKQLYFGKMLIGTASGPKVGDASLEWMCSKCNEHCSTVHHLVSGPKNLHIVSDSEITEMEHAMQRHDILSSFVSQREQLRSPLTTEEEDELIGRQPLRVKFVPNLSRERITDILSKLPSFRMKAETEPTAEPTEPTETETEPKEEPETETEAETEKEAEPEANPEANADGAEEAESAEEPPTEEEDEGEEVLSFYDISAIVRRVREQRRKDLKQRSVTTQDPVPKGPANRAKALKSWTLHYTDSTMKHRLHESEQSNVTSALLHSFSHEITNLKNVSNSDVTQNVRMLRHLQKDSATRWDPNCCTRGSNRLTNSGK